MLKSLPLFALTSVLAFSPLLVSSQATFNSKPSGVRNWSDNAAWLSASPGFSPANNVISVENTMQADFSIAATNSSIIVSAGDTLFLNEANLSMSNVSNLTRTLTVQPNAFLIIDGNVTMSRSNGQFNIVNEGVVAVTGNTRFYTNNYTGLTVSGSGEAYLWSAPVLNEGTIYETTINNGDVYGTYTVNYGNEADFAAKYGRLYSAIGGGGVTVLPVEMLAYSAKSTGRQVNINWATASELNFSHFILEHSTNGQTYKGLTQIYAKGNSSGGATYSFTHKLAASGNNYYRLLAIDIDGLTEDHGTVAAYVTSGHDARIVQNPVLNGELMLNMASLPENAHLEVLDLQGKLVLTRPAQASQNIEATPGLYIVKISTENVIEQYRIVLK